ncbi:HNH endonuclease [Paenibacillus sp. XY044]|uniref:HNH endonuclease n=1 Tax=Paenibacillus sp. XY044 TaxID=2026089 RepID=UPI000B98D0E7|nr:HNH endonuclease [Paenibacillus sp. XY044]OZB98152.1 hypothetical protein CJP46_03005 [Paenibacillus sp. XY044]
MDIINDKLILTDSQKRIVEAYNRGYRVTPEGVFLNRHGVALSIELKSKQRYPSRQISINGKKKNYYIHRLAAYCFYGDEVFKEYIQVRHLNGNVLDISKSNLALGTCSENHHDKSPEVRKCSATKASHSRKNVTMRTLRKLTDEQALNVKMLLHQGVDCVTISKMYKVSDETIRQIKNGLTYKEIKLKEI